MNASQLDKPNYLSAIVFWRFLWKDDMFVHSFYNKGFLLSHWHVIWICILKNLDWTNLRLFMQSWPPKKRPTHIITKRWTILIRYGGYKHPTYQTITCLENERSWAKIPESRGLLQWRGRFGTPSFLRPRTLLWGKQAWIRFGGSIYWI